MEKKYNICYDLLTILACLMVVFFHMNGIVYTYSDTISWKISVIERCVVYSAIPIFFMLSGAKLMEYRSRYSTREYVKKRLIRVGIPFLFWNVFYMVFQRVISPEHSFHSVKDFVSMFLNSEFQDRYWFFFPLFAVYAAIPVISLVLQAKDHRKYLWYTVYAAFVLNWVLKPLCGLLGIRFNSNLMMPVCSGYLMYALFGYLISTEKWSRVKRMALYLLALVSGAFAVCYTINISKAVGETQLAMASYSYFPSALTGAAIFVFVKHLFDKPFVHSALQKNEKFTSLVRTVSNCCMGVWLSHSLAIMVVSHITGFASSNYILRFVFPLIVFPACVAGTYVLKKIPLLKHIV